MKIKFIVFFFLISAAMILSMLDSWIIQAQFHGGVNFDRAVFQVALVGWFLYLLWRRSTAGYILTLLYATSAALIYGYELVQFYVLGNPSAALPASAVIASALLILSAILAVIIFGLDYFDYRKRRIAD
jgi:hypothetical protein